MSSQPKDKPAVVPSPEHSPDLNWDRRDLAWLGATLLVVLLAWCYAYNRWTIDSWKTPVVYGSDGWAEMASAKVFASDDVLPVLPKSPASLGAPFRANWNDHVMVEEPLFYTYGLFVRVFGLSLGSNLILLLAHLLAAIGFYLAARALSLTSLFSALFGFVFAMSSFAIVRSLTHLVLTFYWHVPLGLVVLWWCLNKTPWTARRITIAAAIAVAHGVQNPYYTNIFIQLLGLAFCVNWIRGRRTRELLLPLLFGAIAFLSFVIMSLDTLTFRMAEGANQLVTVRTYVGLELYALKPLELLLPPFHRFAWLQQWTNAHYFNEAMFIGERASPYLGLVGIAGIFWLAWSTATRIARGEFDRIPRHSWIVLWILLYSVVGGLNGLVGTFGMVLFRGTDRYSIVILAIALLFLGERLMSSTRRWHMFPCVVTTLLVAVVALFDQMLRPPPGMEAIAEVRQRFAADKTFAAAMRSRLFPGAMIFQLPVMNYPESDPIQQMGDYEHFRPYLHTIDLRYSYGSDKGRTRERWQGEVAQLDPGAMAATLGRYGFAAILVNRKGYADRAEQLLAGLRSAGQGTVIAQSPDFICLSLTPAAEPTLPPEFDQHWYGIEGTAQSNWRWSNGSASIIFYNDGMKPINAHIRFQLEGGGERLIEIRRSETALYSRRFQANDQPAEVDLDIMVDPGATKLRFITDLPGRPPGNGDPRKLAFAIRDFRTVE